jgi:hypothetical protein
MNGPLFRKGKSILITRRTPGSYVNGKWQDGPSPTTFRAFVSIQPFSLREMLLLPEGERNREHIRIYCDVPLRPLVQETGVKGDLVPYNDRTYEVQQSGTWDIPRQTALPHFKAVAAWVEA